MISQSHQQSFNQTELREVGIRNSDPQGHVGPLKKQQKYLRVDVQILEQDRLGERWLVVDPRTPLPMGAGSRLSKRYSSLCQCRRFKNGFKGCHWTGQKSTHSHLEEEGTIDFVLLRPENARQVLSHLGGSLDGF